MPMTTKLALYVAHFGLAAGFSVHIGSAKMSNPHNPIKNVHMVTPETPSYDEMVALREKLKGNLDEMMDRLRVDEEAAKRAWLAKQDQNKPTWGQATSAAPAVAAAAPAPAVDEDAAKRAWLAKQDQNKPTWGQATSVAPAVAAPAPAVDEDAAKRAWLAKLDESKPSWGQAASSAPAAVASQLSDAAKHMIEVQEQIDCLNDALNSYKEYSMEPGMIHAFLEHAKVLRANL
jgi:hypothetical protein